MCIYIYTYSLYPQCLADVSGISPSVCSPMLHDAGISPSDFGTIYCIPYMEQHGAYGGFRRWAYPYIILFNRNFPDKPSILGFLHLWKSPNGVGKSIEFSKATAPSRVRRCRRTSGRMGCESKMVEDVGVEYIGCV